MKKNYLYIGLVLLMGCQKVSVNSADVLSGLTPLTASIPADGSTPVLFSVILNKDADPTKRAVRFTASPGSWVGGKDSTVSVTATFISGQLIATATLKGTVNPGTILVKVQPDLPQVVNNNFIQQAKVTAQPSPVASVTLQPSAYGLNSNYQGEVTLSGILKNAAGKYASAGVKVLFEDYLAGGAPANGVYRKLVNVSVDTTGVSANYSTGMYPVGTPVLIKATVLDAQGAKTTITNTIQLTINK